MRENLASFLDHGNTWRVVWFVEYDTSILNIVAITKLIEYTIVL